MKSAVKIAWLGFWVSLATVVLFFPVVVAALASRTGNLAFNLSRIWAWVTLKVANVVVEIDGRQHIESDRSYIIISNHQSLFDIPALVTSLGIQFRWIIKKEVLKVPLFGYALYASRNVFIDRKNREQSISSIKKGMTRLPEGAGVMFFAEGTRSPDGKIHKFKKGGFMTALESGLPILPVTVVGSRQVMPKKSLVYTPGVIRVFVGKPIEVSDYDYDSLEDLISKTRQVIVSTFYSQTQ